MSTNIDSVTVCVNEGLRIQASVVRELYRKLSDDLPECHLLDPLLRDAEPMPGDRIDPELAIVDFWWGGEFSGSSYERTLLKKILPRTKGKADLVFCWEGGNGFTGVRVVEGVVTEHKVVQALGPKT